jgi:hypothetical protein
MEMRPNVPWMLSSAALALSLAASAPSSWAQGELQFAELRVFVEINATDGDAGFQASVDADEWREVTIRDPNGRTIYMVKGKGSVGDQGLTENSFESAEPSCEEVPLIEFLDRFPVGAYRFTGKTAEGGILEGEATLTHALPGAPLALTPHAVGGIDSSLPVVITWLPGGGLGNCPPGPGGPPAELVELFGFQVIVEREVPEPLVTFAADVPASATSLTIPAEFLEPGATYKFEVIAIEAREDGGRGNQTISESFFCTSPTTTVDCELSD